MNASPIIEVRGLTAAAVFYCDDRVIDITTTTVCVDPAGGRAGGSFRGFALNVGLASDRLFLGGAAVFAPSNGTYDVSAGAGAVVHETVSALIVDRHVATQAESSEGGALRTTRDDRRDDDHDHDRTPNYLDNDDSDGLRPVFKGNIDSHTDGLPDAWDSNADGDRFAPRLGSLASDHESNPTDATDARDSDSDLTPDYLAVDDDEDHVRCRDESIDPDKNHDPSAASDSDNDGVPDYLDADDGGNEIATAHEDRDQNGSFDDDEDEDGTDGDLDSDDDGDGILTKLEAPDPNRDGKPSHASDGDGDRVPDNLDRHDDSDLVLTLVEGGADRDGDGTADHRDADDDGDGLSTAVERTHTERAESLPLSAARACAGAGT